MRWVPRAEIKVLNSVEIMRTIVDRIECKLNVVNEDAVYGRHKPDTPHLVVCYGTCV